MINPVVALGTVNALMLARIATMKDAYFDTWLSNKPFRLDKENECYDYIEAFELLTAHECAKELCEILSLKMPTILLVGDCGRFLNRRDPLKEIIFKKHSVIRLHYEENLMSRMAYDFFYLYLWQYRRAKFFVNGEVKLSMSDEADTLAYAFALAFMEKHYPGAKWDNEHTAPEFIQYMEENHIFHDVLYTIYEYRDTLFSDET